MLEIVNTFSASFAFGLIACLLFLIIICLLAYHYLRAQVTHAASEAQSIYGLKAERDKLIKEVEVIQGQLNLLRLSFNESEFAKLRQDKAALEREYDVKFRALEDTKSELTTLALEIEKGASRKSGLEREAEKLALDIEQLKKSKEEVDIAVATVANLSDAKKEVEQQLGLLERSLEVVKAEHGKLLKSLEVERGQAERNLNELIGEIKSKTLDLDILKASEQSILEKVGKQKERQAGGEERNESLFDTPQKLLECVKRGTLDLELDERAQLEKFQDSLKKSNYLFTDRVLRSFHTSLKCNDISPLTVLAGVSGTGKTLLPLKYAEFFGISTLVVPVQPRWDSHDDLFGSYNYIEQRFVATDLAKYLVVMDRHNNQGLKTVDCSNRLLLVLLDEMNLARTEYYFSEFLSRLELRRGLDEKNSEQRERAELKTGKDSNIRLWVGNNVFFVGTMNEDESTQTLSDKVLDRANVLRFSAPSFGKSSSRAGNEGGFLGSDKMMTVDLWDRWAESSKASFSIADSLNKSLSNISKIMAKLGRPFGHRIRDSIVCYVDRYPLKDPASCKVALVDQIEQRLLPKFRGVQLTDDNRGQINELINEIETLGDEPLAEGIRKCLYNSDMDLFFWTGISREEG